MKFVLLILLTFFSVNSFAGPGGFKIYSSEDGVYKVCIDWLGVIKVGVPYREERIYELEFDEEGRIYVNSDIGVEFNDIEKKLRDHQRGLEIHLEHIRNARFGYCSNFLLKVK